MQGVQVLHGYYHHHTDLQKDTHFAKDPVCKICDHLLAKKYQQLTGEVYTLVTYRTRPAILQIAACISIPAIALPNDLNKGPPTVI